MMNKLPLNILLQIMGEDQKIAFNLVFSLPKFGRFSVKFQAQIQRLFLVRDEGDCGNPTFPQKGTFYKLNGLYHRPQGDGPAIEYDNGSKAWYEHGKWCRQTWDVSWITSFYGGGYGGGSICTEERGWGKT
jgi:hypothetical protein